MSNLEDKVLFQVTEQYVKDVVDITFKAILENKDQFNQDYLPTKISETSLFRFKQACYNDLVRYCDSKDFAELVFGDIVCGHLTKTIQDKLIADESTFNTFIFENSK